MKSEYLISYRVFCQRKNFSLENYLRNNDTITYENLQQEFFNISVEPPKKFLYETLMEKIRLEKIPEKKKVEAPSKTTTKTVKKSKEEKPTPKRRRRRKANAN